MQKEHDCSLLVIVSVFLHRKFIYCMVCMQVKAASQCKNNTVTSWLFHLCFVLVQKPDLLYVCRLRPPFCRHYCSYLEREEWWWSPSCRSCRLFISKLWPKTGTHICAYVYVRVHIQDCVLVWEVRTWLQTIYFYQSFGRKQVCIFVHMLLYACTPQQGCVYYRRQTSIEARYHVAKGRSSSHTHTHTCIYTHTHTHTTARWCVHSPSNQFRN